MKFKLLLLFFLTVISRIAALAQINEDSLTNAIAPELDLITTVKKEEKKVQPKKKKNEYLGIKTKKQFIKVGSGPRQTIELFNLMTEFKEPNPYIRDVYWYDSKTKKITLTKKIDKSNMRLLHGPYKKMVGGKLVEEGFYYMGTKHGRWEQYNANFTLVDKTKYHKGWLEESQIIYYDAAKTKIKEVIPVEFGVKTGDYFSYYEEGQLEMEGRYDNGVKVGKWTEYYQYRRRKKKEIQYAASPFDKDFEPYVIREWDDKGKLTFDREEEEKKKLSKF